jgi:hypothetical protein
MGRTVGLCGGGRCVGGLFLAPVDLTRVILQSPASPGPNGLFYSIGGSPAVTLDPNGLFYVGSRGLASLSAGAYLEGPPVGFNVGVLVGPGVVLRSCGRRSSDGPLACPGDRRPLRVLLILILILIILTREIVFVRKGELLPGPGRAVLVDGLDDNRGTGGGGAALACQRGLGGPAASAARGLVVVDVGRGTAAPDVCGLVPLST